MLENNDDIDETVTIFAGKFRRYHNESWWQRMFDLKTHWLNFRDLLFILLGFMQSVRLISRYKPNAVFLKGGFVGVPVGLAAGIYKKPIMTHDSDAVAGLANRVVSRFVSIHATALAADCYSYPSAKVLQVGVIVSHNYRRVKESDKKAAKAQLKLPEDARLLLITGGSTGAVAVNTAAEELYQRLLNEHSNLYIIHQTGKGKAGDGQDYAEYSRLQRMELLDDMHVYTAAADVIVMRAGANTLAELAMQGKACIVVPNPHLPAGHQLRNADYYDRHDAILTVQQKELEENPEILHRAIVELLEDEDKRQQLEDAFHQEAHRGAGTFIAQKLYALAQEVDSKDKDK